VSQLFIRTCTNQITSWLVRNWNIFAACKHRLTRFTMTQTWGKPPPSPYSILCAWPRGLHPNVILSRDSRVGSPEIFEFGTLTTLEAHNFLCRPPIEVRSKAKLYPSLRSFQKYIAHHLHISKSRQFPTFSGWELNWQFDSWPSFWP